MRVRHCPRASTTWPVASFFAVQDESVWVELGLRLFRLCELLVRGRLALIRGFREPTNTFPRPFPAVCHVGPVAVSPAHAADRIDMLARADEFEFLPPAGEKESFGRSCPTPNPGARGNVADATLLGRFERKRGVHFCSAAPCLIAVVLLRQCFDAVPYHGFVIEELVKVGDQ